jgi:hypothetical protein
VDVKDKEDWAKIDAEYAIDNGAWESLKFGARYNEHKRESLDVIGQGPLAPPMDPANYPTTFDNYPSDFNGFGGSFPKNIWFWTPEQLAQYNGPDNVNRDPLTRADWNSMYIVEEKNAAAYVQADFQGASWSANVGVRYVRTDENVVSFVSAADTDPGAIIGSAFGTYKRSPTDHTYTDVLPSANLKWDIQEDLVARFACRDDDDTSRLLGARRLRFARLTANERGRARRRIRRQPGPRADPLYQLRRWTRVVLREGLAAVGRHLLHGPRQLRLVRYRDQVLFDVQRSFPQR